MMHAHTGNAVTIRFALPSAKLCPFVTTYYYTKVAASPAEPVLQDYLHPEWANLRFTPANWAKAAIGADAPLATTPAFSVTGPTSMATQFQIASGRSWGIGLMPLGWASLFDACASDYADQVVNGNADHVFAAFQPLARALAQSGGDFAEELELIERHMERITFTDHPQAPKIAAINTALVDPDLASVSSLAERAEMSVRSLERVSKQAFGFTPQLLLRRQRFLRSLAQFMLDPSLKWLSTLDYQYHDQAHFVRDFKRFMGVSPSVYAKFDKPLLIAAARARMEIAGEAVQGLHKPVGVKT